MLIFLNRLFFIMSLSFLSSLAQAQDGKISDMLSDIEKKQSTPDLKLLAISMGKERAVLCNQCHGADGNSKKPDVPNLAAQNPEYLLEQIEKFANGSRKNYVMNTLSKNFTSEDKVNLALFYASMKVKPVKIDMAIAKKGKESYISRCSSCHGEKGAGKENFARIAGQQIHYVENTLRRFRGNAQSKSKEDISSRRSIAMESIAKDLSDDEISVLAAYIAQLK